MARVHGLEHVEGLASTNLTHDDAVRTHTEGVANELADLHFPGALDVGRTRFEWKDVFLVELELLGILHRHDALAVGDEAGENVQERGLPGTGTAAHNSVQPTTYTQVDELRDLWSERAETDQVVDGVRVLGELPDRHERAADGERVHDDVHAGAVGKTRIHHRVRFVDAPANLAHDLVDDAADVYLVHEAHRRLLDAAGALHVDSVRAVHHHFRDVVLAEQWVDRSVSEHVVGDGQHQLLTLRAGERKSLLRKGAVELFVDLAPEVGLADALVEEQRSQLVDHELVHLLAHVLERGLALGASGAAVGPSPAGLLTSDRGLAGRRLPGRRLLRGRLLGRTRLRRRLRRLLLLRPRRGLLCLGHGERPQSLLAAFS